MKQKFTLQYKWLLDVFNHMTSDAGKSIIENGWKSVGISDAVPKGLSGLEKINPFNSIDLLMQESEDMLIYQSECVGLNILFRDQMKQTMITMINELVKKDNNKVAIFSKNKPDIFLNYWTIKMNKKWFDINIYFL